MPKDNEVDEKVIAMVCLVPSKRYPHFAGVEVQLYGGYEPRIGDEFYSAATVAELRAEVERLVKALDEAACELSAAGQALAEFEGFEFRQKAAIDRAYAASQKAHDANGYTEALHQEKPDVLP